MNERFFNTNRCEKHHSEDRLRVLVAFSWYDPAIPNSSGEFLFIGERDSRRVYIHGTFDLDSIF